MSYEPTNWKAGDTITSAKLNKIEQGVANGIWIIPVIIEYDENENHYVAQLGNGNITFQVLEDAMRNGTLVILSEQEEDNDYIEISNYPAMIQWSDGTYKCYSAGICEFRASSKTDPLIYQDNGDVK